MMIQKMTLFNGETFVEGKDMISSFDFFANLSKLNVIIFIIYFFCKLLIVQVVKLVIYLLREKRLIPLSLLLIKNYLKFECLL